MPEFKFDRMLSFFKPNRPQGGTIFLEDGKTRCRSVVCREGVFAKDIIAEVCSIHEPQITPVAYPFFALCDRQSLHPISPYKKITAEDTKKQYQLRLFVNTGGNSQHFQKMSKSTYTYYHKQLKEDFIQDRLFPRATINTAVWMVAIDMAREALEKKKDFADLTRNVREMQKFMPKFLVEKYQKDQEMRQKLKSTFKKFSTIQEHVTPDHFVSKYSEVYEKDKMCGRHIYRLRQGGRQRVQFLLVVSSKDGVYKTRGDDPTEERETPLCHIEEVRSLKADFIALSATMEIVKQAGTKSFETLHFTEKKELVSFSVVVHTYHQILVDANAVLLAGDLTPPEECLLIGKNDGYRRDICHGPITPNEVNKVLKTIEDMRTGNYLIRESRNNVNAYTLSLCSRKQIFNYRIIRLVETGEYCFEGSASGEGRESHTRFSTLKELIHHYEQIQNGLPCKLSVNICPKIVPIPLMPMISSGSDTSSSTGSVFVSDRNHHHRELSDFSSIDQTPTSTVPSSPTSTSSNNLHDPHHTPVITHPHSTSNSPHPISDSSVPDTSVTSPVPQPSDCSSHPSSILFSTSPHSPSTPCTPSPVTHSPNMSDSRFLEHLAPRQPSIELDGCQLIEPQCEYPQTPLIRELIEVGVNYISFSELKIIGDLGSGNYSQVHLAEWTKQDGISVEKVAVKIPTAKPNTVNEVKKELKREIETMAALDHSNIVHLLGISEVQHFISYIGELPVVIMEYVEGGSLRGFLDRVKRSPNLANTRLFLSYGKQIADGMMYLEEKKLVHRDLAARNVLLIKETEQVKISDFGLARQSNSTTKDYAYYIGQTSSNGLPIFWYAPECLRNLKFTTKGDVWSYGVTLWEMFSHGELPTHYLGRIIKDPSVVSAQLAFKKLAEHLEVNSSPLPKKIHCPTEVYIVMLDCWNCKASERPSFTQLSDTMGKLLDLAKKKAAPRVS